MRRVHRITRRRALKVAAGAAGATLPLVHLRTAGAAGKLPKQFGLANSIDCRNENELLVGEVTNWRVQKVTLRAAR